MKFILIVLGFIIAILFCFLLLYLYLVRKLNAFGFKGLRLSKIKDEIESIEEAPRQVSGMTNVWLPQILKRFKEFNLDQIYLLTEKSIRRILSAIENKDLSLLEDKDFNMINKKIKLQLEDLINSDILYKYDDIVFHKHAIKKYSYNNGIAYLEIVSSLEYYYSKERDGKVLVKADKKTQTRYITKYVYIVDSDAYENDINVYGLNCPNCGAVIDALENRKCKYCGTSLNIQVVDLLKCWKLIDYKENK